MATYTKRNGKIQARFQYYDQRGKRKFKAKSFATKTEAQAWAKRFESEALINEGLEDTKQTFVDYFVEWYEAYEERNIAPATQKWYLNTIRIITAYFGKTKLVDMRRNSYQRFLNDFGADHSRESSMKVNSQIKMAVRSAIDDGLIKRNFTANTTISGNDGKDKELKYLDGAAMWRLIKYCESHLSPESPSYAMILTGLFTGFRVAEVAGLQESDVDYVTQTIRVDNTYDWETGGFKPTKNPQSRRIVSVAPELLESLQRLHRAQKDLGVPNPSSLLFVNVKGQVPSNNGVNKVLKAACRKLGIKEVTFHALRHTHASYLISQGVSIYTISERLGHKSYTTTLDVYAHVQQEFRATQDHQVQAVFERTQFIKPAVGK